MLLMRAGSKTLISISRTRLCSLLVTSGLLCRQIVSLQERLSRLEQEREHWMLETQLMQMKYDKESQVC